MKLLLAKHAETEENRRGVLQGWLPGQLSAEGRRQAGLLAERLKDVAINAIYTSDLHRSCETARTVASYHPNIPVTPERRLRARGLGEFEGKPKNDAAWSALSGDYFTNRPNGGESLFEVLNNLRPFYRTLLAKHSEDVVFVVGHGEGICTLQNLIVSPSLKNLEGALRAERIGNTAMSEFDVGKDGTYKLIRLNCTKHLEGGVK